MHHAYTTSTLAHFVGRAAPADHDRNCSVLESILAAGCVSHAPHTKGFGTVSYTVDPGKSLHDEGLIVPTVTCFADIPESSLGVHVQKYGCFGLGFNRDFLIKAGARPVTYVPKFSQEWRHAVNGRYLLDDIEATYRGFRDHYARRITERDKPVPRTLMSVPTNEDETLRALKELLEKDFLAFLKPFNAELPSDHPDSFYMEREWRKYAYLRFSPEDVERVWVAPGYVGRIESSFPYLASKVSSLPLAA